VNIGVTTDRACHAWRRRAGDVDHLLNGKPQLKSMQWVANADLSLNLLIRQRRHDRSTLDVRPTRRHVPRRHPQPQLPTYNNNTHIMAFFPGQLG